MMIARWHVDAKFGHKSKVVESLQNWHREIGTQIGWSQDRVRILTGSVGTKEATVISEVAIEDLSALHASWEKLATIEAHRNWSKELEPYVVSGSMYWEILRVV